MSQPNNRYIYIISFAAIAAMLVFQLLHVTRPFSGHFASYQCVMAAMARNFVAENFKDLLNPKLDSLLFGAKALHLNQYPFPSLVAALGVSFLKGGYELWGRLQAVLANLATLLFLFHVGRKMFGDLISGIAVVIFALAPYSMIYGQAFMSEPLALLSALVGLCFYLKVKPDQNDLHKVVLAGFFLSLAITGRVHFILMMAPFGVDLLLYHSKKKILKGFLLLGTALILPILWTLYTYQASFQSANVITNVFIQVAARPVGDQMYLSNPEYYKRLIEIFGVRLLSPLGFPFFCLGAIVSLLRRERFDWLLLSGAFSTLLLCILAPQKIMAHDFYLYAAFPFVVLLTAIGIHKVFMKLNAKAVIPFMIGGLCLYAVVSARFFINPIYTEGENADLIQETAKYVEEFTEPTDKLIVFGRGPAEMFYYANRPGWPMDPGAAGKPLAYYVEDVKYKKNPPGELSKLRESRKSLSSWFEYLRDEGAQYLLAFNKAELVQYSSFFEELKDEHKLISKEQDPFYLFKLRSK